MARNLITTLSLALLFLTGFVPAVRADRDIVYAARYYAPPGSHRTSRFHLYRINPDGTRRTQITFGKHDDKAPQWSPDGRRILFERNNDLCLISAEGGPIRVLVPQSWDFSAPQWSPDGRWITYLHMEATFGTNNTEAKIVLIEARTGRTRIIGKALCVSWSPNGQRLYLHTQAHDLIYDLQTGQRRLLPQRTAGDDTNPGGQYPLWQTPNRILAISPALSFAKSPKDRPSLTFLVLNPQGAVLRRIPALCPDNEWLPDPTDTPAPSPPASTADQWDWRIYGAFLPIPKTSRRILWAIDYHVAGEGPANDFYLVDLASGHWRHVGQDRSLSLSPSGQRCCVVPMLGSSAYAPRAHPFRDSPSESQEQRVANRFRLVYTAPLLIRNLTTGHDRKIVRGLVWVIEADWRKTGGR